MGFVDVEYRVLITAFYFCQSIDVSPVAVHAVHTFGYYYQLIAISRSLFRQSGEMPVVVVAEACERQSREPDAVDYACVHKLVGEDVIA